MADWGVGIYENDDAMDWIYDLVESSSLSRVKKALDIVAQDHSGSLELADYRVALAAADIVAGLDGDMNPRLPEEAEEWINLMNRSAFSLKDEAWEVVSEIIENSKLRSKIEAGGNLPQWKEIMEGLLERLAP